MNWYTIVLIVFTSISYAFAQDIKTVEVKVVERFNPEIPQANRLNENAVFSDSIVKDRMQIYDLIDADLGSNYKTKKLNSAQIKDDKISKLYGTTFGLGFGNISRYLDTPLL